MLRPHASERRVFSMRSPEPEVPQHCCSVEPPRARVSIVYYSRSEGAASRLLFAQRGVRTALALADYDYYSRSEGACP